MVALKKQLLYEISTHNIAHKSIETIFIGGGTPSTVPPNLYKPLFDILKPYLQGDIEITSEANPNSATYEWLFGMYTLGVNRISFGVQSFDEQKLKLLNRAHSAKDAHKAIADADKIGYSHLSIDLIYNTQIDTNELLQNDIEIALSLPIDHLSAYSLTIEENTPFANTPEVAKEQMQLTSTLFDSITASGFEHYEISNFGTYQSKHNLGYWKYKDYIGLGSGAVGKIGYTRFYPSKDIQSYIQDPYKSEKESLSEDAIQLEKLFLGFRSIIGVSAALLSTEENEKAKLLLKEKKLYVKNGNYYNPNFLLADEIVLFLQS